jgi:hypothetical protein
MLAYLVEDVTLVKLTDEGTTRIHVRFRAGQTTTLKAVNPKSSCEMVRTPPTIVALVDRLLDNHIYSEIAAILNEQGLHPGGAARPGRQDARFTEHRVAYIVHRYGLRSRYERLRERGMLTKRELAKRLGIHEGTVVPWAEHGIVKRHAYNGHFFLYEDPGLTPPTKHCSRWDRLVDRAAAIERAGTQAPSMDAEKV